jgi:hypothetical protein
MRKNDMNYKDIITIKPDKRGAKLCHRLRAASTHRQRMKLLFDESLSPLAGAGAGFK